jgi:hypothetical protein
MQLSARERLAKMATGAPQQPYRDLPELALEPQRMATARKRRT